MDIISQAGPPFELGGSVTLAGMGWALQRRQQKERNPGLEEGRNWKKPQRATAPDSIRSAPPTRASQKGTACHM